MLRSLKRWAKRYPEQAFLFIFNTGIFAWLQTTGLLIADRVGIHLQTVQNLIPEWLRVMIGNSVQSLQSYFGNSAISWLVMSMILTILIRFITGILKTILLIAIVLIGLYLVYKNYDILTQLL
ncbi:hypothetical protein [Streptococcus loxodontisalivarius]|uniref:Uncharacterized protein n=1 Tax=Streptococcus loxodontisalivarius TaxID=1349415 RepID=A0ABS2PP48_9STRE|nr:hypothetical protein [Streptococcus loxodontisalivarius]MBM7641723.1 hypothetical protein [Streptococcus loxodontisalivarius]